MGLNIKKKLLKNVETTGLEDSNMKFNNELKSYYCQSRF